MNILQRKLAGDFVVDLSGSSFGGPMPRSRSSSSQAMYLGPNGDAYQRSASIDDIHAQVSIIASFISIQIFEYCKNLTSCPTELVILLLGVFNGYKVLNIENFMDHGGH